MNSNNWPLVEVQDVCELIVDCVNKTAKKVDYETPYRMLRTTNIRGGKIDLTDCKFVEKDTFEKWTRRAKVLPGDVLLTREAPIGEVGYVRSNDNLFLGQRIMQYRVNPNKLDSRYLLYSFLSPSLKHQFGSHEGSGSVVSHIRVGDCFKFQIALPPLVQQRQIAEVLGSLDDKIELNRQMNQTLEAMAQAIFQSWFVDFEPVKAKQKAKAAGKSAAEIEMAAIVALSGKSEEEVAGLGKEVRSELGAIAGLFSDELVESELGLIPEGWVVGELGQIAKNRRNQLDPTSLEVIMPYVGLEHIGKKVFILDNWGKSSDVESAKSRFQRGDILFGKLRPYFHKVCRAPFEGICSTDILVVHAYKPALRSFVSSILFTEVFVEFANRASTGTRMPRANWEYMKEYKIAVPPEKLAEQFSIMVESLWQKAERTISESQTLAELRDSLLPKLLSGELTLPAAQTQATEALDESIL